MISTLFWATQRIADTNTVTYTVGRRNNRSTNEKTINRSHLQQIPKQICKTTKAVYIIRTYALLLGLSNRMAVVTVLPRDFRIIEALPILIFVEFRRKDPPVTVLLKYRDSHRNRISERTYVPRTCADMGVSAWRPASANAI